VVTPLPSPLKPEYWGPDRPLVDQLKWAVLAADAALERGDVERAIQAVDRYAVWRAREAQSFARLAEAYLLLEDDTSWFRKSLALASFCHVHDEAPAARRELPFPGGTWDRWRLDALRDRCAAWLEEG